MKKHNQHKLNEKNESAFSNIWNNNRIPGSPFLFNIVLPVIRQFKEIKDFQSRKESTYQFADYMLPKPNLAELI